MGTGDSVKSEDIDGRGWGALLGFSMDSPWPLGSASFCLVLRNLLEFLSQNLKTSVESTGTLLKNPYRMETLVNDSIG